MLGHDVDNIAREAIAYGCHDVHVIDDPLLERYLSRPYGKALSDLCKLVKPEIVLIGATSMGRDLAGIVATKIETGLTADCTGLDIDEEKQVLLMTRPTFGGNIMATIFCEHHRPQMSTVRPNVFKLPPKGPGAEPALSTITPLCRPRRSFLKLLILSAIVLGGVLWTLPGIPPWLLPGKGPVIPESMPMLEELAEVVGGVVACSRPVVEAGLMPYERQVGQTGKTVAPDLYFAIGVSGAVQHLVGMQGSGKIVAINADPEGAHIQRRHVGHCGRL